MKKRGRASVGHVRPAIYSLLINDGRDLYQEKLRSTICHKFTDKGNTNGNGKERMGKLTVK